MGKLLTNLEEVLAAFRAGMSINIGYAFVDSSQIRLQSTGFVYIGFVVGSKWPKVLSMDAFLELRPIAY